MRTFDREGGSIGRAPGNDWVLPDPSKFVSSRHANIEVVGTEYFLCDMSTNGTFVNGSVEAIGYGSKVRLNHGDRIQIGEYELAATVTADQPGFGPAAPGPAPGGGGAFDAGASPFGTPPPPPAFGQGSPFGQPPPSPFEQAPAPPPAPPSSDFSGGQTWPPPPSVATPPAQFGAEPLWDPDPSPGGAPQDPLEIMSSRGAGGHGLIGDINDPNDRYRQIPPSGQGAWQDSDPLEDHFAVPSALPDSEPLSGQIPADWDKTTFPRQPESPPPPPASSPTGYAGQALPTDWDTDPEPVSSAPPAQLPPSMAQMPPPAPVGIPPTQPGAMGVVPPAHGMPPPAAYAGAALVASDGGVLQRILEGAGMDPAAARVAIANPELTDTLGQVLQIFIEGMMDVLRARSEVKDTFKLHHTVMKPVENNPLKFFPNGREALAALFTKQGSGYLSPVEATRQAFDDTKAHQMAMMAGMQAAFESLMKRFDPEVLQREFDEVGHGGMFKGRNKAKYWDGLVALYTKQMRNPDDSFRRLFGEPFAEAYEEQMQRLTNVRRRH